MQSLLMRPFIVATAAAAAAAAAAADPWCLELL
jgi:hypothetical protein